jgi:nucleotide-binding universal stress UspA family protein
MGGTVLCGVTATSEGRGAVQLAGALSDRLGLRLVLAHVVDVHPTAHESLTARQGEIGAARAVQGVARDLGLREVGIRVVMGHRAEQLAWVAAEEGAEMIVLGSRAGGFRDRQLRCRLAGELESETSVPVVIAPPQTRPRGQRRLTLADSAAAG